MSTSHIIYTLFLCGLAFNTVSSFGNRCLYLIFSSSRLKASVLLGVLSKQPVSLRVTSLRQQLKSDTNEKLIYDAKTNRFYEGNVNTEDEEFCLKDGATGEVIMLTRVRSCTVLKVFLI